MPHADRHESRRYIEPHGIISRAEAKAMGLRWYFTGQPCSHGHIAKRKVGNCDCRACEHERKLGKLDISLSTQPDDSRFDNPMWFVRNDAQARYAMARARVCYDWEAMKAARAKCPARPLSSREKRAVLEARPTALTSSRCILSFNAKRHREVLACRNALSPRRIPFEKLAEIVTVVTGYSVADLLAPGREYPRAAARLVLMWVACQYSGERVSDVARRLQRDHSSVFKALTRVDEVRLGGGSGGGARAGQITRYLDALPWGL